LGNPGIKNKRKQIVAPVLVVRKSNLWSTSALTKRSTKGRPRMLASSKASHEPIASPTVDKTVPTFSP
jgi:hypothetical protein